MVPTSVVLSPESYAAVQHEKREAENDSSLSLSHLLALPVSVRPENTDIVVVKELVPNPCPICHHRLRFLREMIEHFEDDDTKLIRCPLGHRYPGQMKIYHLNILQAEENPETEKGITACPTCGSESIQYLGPMEMFCLDCDWDSGMTPRYKD